MMELFTIKKDVFRPIIATLTSFREEVEIMALDDHVEACFIDQTNAAFCQMILKTAPAQKTAFKVKIVDWLSAVGTPKEDVIVSLDGNKVNLQWSKKPKVSKSFAMLVDQGIKSVDTKIMEKSSEYLTTRVHLDAPHALEFYNLLKDIASSSNKDSSAYLYFDKNDSGCFFTDSSDEPYTVEVDEFQVTGADARSKFCHEYFIGFMTYQKYFDQIILQFGTDSPCMMTMENEDVLFNILVAPRIDSDT